MRIIWTNHDTQRTKNDQTLYMGANTWATLEREGYIWSAGGPYCGRLVRLLKYGDVFWIIMLGDDGWVRLSRDFPDATSVNRWEADLPKLDDYENQT
jgi:hypothetical protein